MDIKTKLTLDTSQFDAKIAAFQERIGSADKSIGSLTDGARENTKATKDLGTAAANTGTAFQAVGNAANAAGSAIGNSADQAKTAKAAVDSLGNSLEKAGAKAQVSAEQIVSIGVLAATQLVGVAGSAIEAYGGEQAKEVGGYFQSAAASALALGAAMAPLGPIGMAAGAGIGAVFGAGAHYFNQVAEEKEAAEELRRTLNALGDSYDQLARQIKRIDSVEGLNATETDLKDKLYALQNIQLRDGFTDTGKAELEEIRDALDQIEARREQIVAKGLKGLGADLEEFNQSLAQNNERTNWLTKFQSADSITQGQMQADRVQALQDQLSDLYNQLDAARQEKNLETASEIAKQIKELATYTSTIENLKIKLPEIKPEAKSETILAKLQTAVAAEMPTVDAMQKIGALVGRGRDTPTDQTPQKQLAENRKTNRTLSDIAATLKRSKVSSAMAWA